MALDDRSCRALTRERNLVLEGGEGGISSSVQESNDICHAIAQNVLNDSVDGGAGYLFCFGSGRNCVAFSIVGPEDGLRVVFVERSTFAKQHAVRSGSRKSHSTAKRSSQSKGQSQIGFLQFRSATFIVGCNGWCFIWYFVGIA